MPIDQKKLSLENFVFWLVNLSHDDKFFYRKNICETVQKFGKENVLEEIEKQSKNFKDIGSAVTTAQMVKGIKNWN